MLLTRYQLNETLFTGHASDTSHFTVVDQERLMVPNTFGHTSMQSTEAFMFRPNVHQQNAFVERQDGFVDNPQGEYGSKLHFTFRVTLILHSQCVDFMYK